MTIDEIKLEKTKLAKTIETLKTEIGYEEKILAMEETRRREEIMTTLAGIIPPTSLAKIKGADISVLEKAKSYIETKLTELDG